MKACGARPRSPHRLRCDWIDSHPLDSSLSPHKLLRFRFALLRIASLRIYPEPLPHREGAHEFVPTKVRTPKHAEIPLINCNLPLFD